MSIPGRKAQQSLIQTVINVVIASVVVIAIIVLGVKVSQLVTSDQGSQVSFERMENGILALLESPDASVCHISVSFDDHEGLAGFNKGDVWVKRSALWGTHDEELARPLTACPLDTACLALCNVGWATEDNDCQEENLFDSHSFEDVARFVYFLESPDSVPFLYYGSDGTTEQFSLRKIGTKGRYLIEIHNTEQKIALDSQPCETLVTDSPVNA